MSDLYVSQRDVTVTSTTGHTIRFTKGVPVSVPYQMRRLCLERGVLPADPTAPVLDDDDSQPAKPDAPLSLQERDELIREAMIEMIETKKRDDFTATGLPKVDRLAKITGFEVSMAERDRIWLDMKRG